MDSNGWGITSCPNRRLDNRDKWKQTQHLFQLETEMKIQYLNFTAPSPSPRARDTHGADPQGQSPGAPVLGSCVPWAGIWGEKEVEGLRDNPRTTCKCGNWRNIRSPGDDSNLTKDITTQTHADSKREDGSCRHCRSNWGNKPGKTEALKTEEKTTSDHSDQWSGNLTACQWKILKCIRVCLAGGSLFLQINSLWACGWISQLNSKQNVV